MQRKHKSLSLMVAAYQHLSVRKKPP